MIIMPVHHAAAIPANTLVKQLDSDRDEEDRTGKEGDRTGNTQQSNVLVQEGRPGGLWEMCLHSEGAIDVL